MEEDKSKMTQDRKTTNLQWFESPFIQAGQNLIEAEKWMKQVAKEAELKSQTAYAGDLATIKLSEQNEQHLILLREQLDGVKKQNKLLEDQLYILKSDAEGSKKKLIWSVAFNILMLLWQ